MNRLLAAFAFAFAVALPGQISARDLKTMHFENDLARPADVVISGARPDQVVLYCTTVSAGCKTMRAHLHKIGIDFVDKDPKGDPVAGSEFDALGGQGVPLVVFKHRLMHGYYPASFDRLYAQYHSGTAPAPAPAAAVASAARTQATSAAPASVRTAAPVSPVERIAPASIAAYLQSHPDVVVQFTSPDERCRYCVETYPGFDAAARAYGQAARFVRVEWAPWNAFPKEVSGFDFGGLPIQIAYRAGKEIARFDGSLMNKSDAFGAFVKQAYTLNDTFPASPVALDEILPENLPAYLMRHRRAAVQFTSPDPNCQPCAASYALFEEIAAKHRGRLAFARVQWMPWQRVPTGPTTHYKLRVVPEIKAFKDGQLADTLAGTTRARLGAWLNQQFEMQP